MAAAWCPRENGCRMTLRKDSYATVSQARAGQRAQERARLLGVLHHARLRGVPALLLRGLHGPCPGDGPHERADGRAGERGRYPGSVLHLHRAGLLVPGALRQPFPAAPPQARVRALRAVRYGARRGLVCAGGRDGARGRGRAGAGHRARRRALAGVRGGRRVRLRHPVATRLHVIRGRCLVDRGMLRGGVRPQRDRRRPRHRPPAADRARLSRARSRAHAARGPGGARGPGVAGGGPARGGVGSVPVPARLLHRVHHPHGVRGLLRDVAGGAPGRRGVGRAGASAPRALLGRNHGFHRQAGDGARLQHVDGAGLRMRARRRGRVHDGRGLPESRLSPSGRRRRASPARRWRWPAYACSSPWPCA